MEICILESNNRAFPGYSGEAHNNKVMNKSTNKYRHKWVEPFDAPFTYICSKCGKHKIKETMYTATYYDENMNPLGSKSPECVSKQPS